MASRSDGDPWGCGPEQLEWGRHDRARWYVDNLIINGRIRPQSHPSLQPHLTALTPRRQLLFSGVSADQYYSVQYATNLTSEWKPLPGAENLRTNGTTLLADLAGLNGPSIFLRGLTSVERLPLVDLEGFWRVTYLLSRGDVWHAGWAIGLGGQ